MRELGKRLEENKGFSIHTSCFLSEDGSEERERERSGEKQHTGCVHSVPPLSSPPSSAVIFSLRPNFHTIRILK